MKLIVTISIAFILIKFDYVSAQTIEIDSMNIEVSIDEPPQFNGGDPKIEFRKYILENLKYPKICFDNNITGWTVAAFFVNKKGKISKVYVIESNDPAFTRETKRVIKSSPPWKPGKHKGSFVEVYYTIPITFAME